MLKWAAAWVPMVVIAIINGAARALWYGPGLGKLLAHQISTITAIAFFGVYIWLMVRRLAPESLRHAVAIGLMWLVMTIAFEFLFGHYVAERSWSQLLENSNLLAGRLWPFILFWVAAAPPFFYRLQRRTTTAFDQQSARVGTIRNVSPVERSGPQDSR